MSVQATGALNLLYIFDNFALDPDRRELRSGAAAIAMEPQAFDLLVYLIRQREQVVSRDELIESIWGGRIVSESALSTRINAVRSAIGDSGTDQRLIKTLPRKGIRFIGDVREERRPCEMVSAGSIERHGAEIIDLHQGLLAPQVPRYLPDADLAKRRRVPVVPGRAIGAQGDSSVRYLASDPPVRHRVRNWSRPARPTVPAR